MSSRQYVAGQMPRARGAHTAGQGNTPGPDLGQGSGHAPAIHCSGTGGRGVITCPDPHPSLCGDPGLGQGA